MADIFKLSGQKLKELRDKIRKGDFSSLLGFTKEKPTVHPAEVSALLEDLPVENVRAAFDSFPLPNRSRYFRISICRCRKISSGICRMTERRFC